MKTKKLSVIIILVFSFAITAGCNIPADMNTETITGIGPAAVNETARAVSVGGVWMNPVAYWSFDQSASQENDIVWDVSGNGANGRIAARYVTCGAEQGHFGQAAHFFDVFRVGDIIVKNRSGFQIKNQMTIACWIKPIKRPVGGMMNIINKWYDSQDAYWFGFNDEGKIEFAISFGPGLEDDYRVISREPLPLNEWTHCAAVYDGRRLILYLQGSPAETSNLPQGYSNKSIRDSTHDIHLGNYPYMGEFPKADFMIDELWFFDYSLKPNQVNKIRTTDPSQLRWTGTVNKPVFTPAGGVFSKPPVAVAISCETYGAAIYYTTDGSRPSPTHGQPYTGPISVTATATLRAMAHKEGWTDSRVVNEALVILSEPQNIRTQLVTMSTAILLWDPPEYTGFGNLSYQVESPTGIVSKNKFKRTYGIIELLNAATDYRLDVSAISTNNGTSYISATADPQYVKTLPESSPAFPFPIKEAVANGYFTDTGADLYIRRGAPCYAIADGYVTDIYENGLPEGGIPNYVVLIRFKETPSPASWADHKLSWRTNQWDQKVIAWDGDTLTGKPITLTRFAYVHLQEVTVQPGQQVYVNHPKTGQPTLIGYSGRRNGVDHLHFTFATQEINYYDIYDSEKNLLISRIDWWKNLGRDQVYDLLGLSYSKPYSR